MKRIEEFLTKAGTFYLATVEGNQARVRPFGAVCIRDNRLYICTNNQKACYSQMNINPRVELCAAMGGEWLRLTGEVVRDGSKEAREAMLAAHPSLKSMYAADDGKFEVLYFNKGQAAFYAFGKPTETVPLT